MSRTKKRREPRLPFPDFLGIGAPRSGTSWLAKNLSRHPDLWTPPLKELHYFDQRAREPSFGAPVARLLAKQDADDWYPWVWRYQLMMRLRGHRGRFDPQGLVWDLRFFGRSPSDRWYASLFRGAKGKTKGEITPQYSILEEEGVARIHNLMPHARIIFLMRNPIERAYAASVWRLHMLIARNLLEGQTVEGATEEQLHEGFDHPEVTAETDYLRIIEKWQRFYAADQIFVGFIEDIHFHPVRLLRHIYKFLDVDPSFAQKALKRKVNARSPGEMPAWAAVHLARRYHEDLILLSERFGGYASFWLYCAERLADSPVDEKIPYPLWNSWLWKEWTESSDSPIPAYPRRGRVQSGALA
jgi:Sulfotransferase family